MAVSDGNPVNASISNAAWVSKTSTSDQSMVAKLETSDTTSSTNKDTGSIVTEGGLGVEENINAGGTIITTDTTGSTSKDTGSIITEGGVGIEENLYVGGLTNVTGNMTAANFTGTSSGTNTGDVTLANVGSSPNADGATIVGQALNLEPADGSNPGVVSTASQNFAGNKTFDDDVIVTGDLTVNGTTTTVNTATLDVTDPNILLNDGGNQATANSAVAGITVEMSDATDARLGYDSSLASFFKAGESGSESEIITASPDQTMSGDKTFTGKVATDFNDVATTATINQLTVTSSAARFTGATATALNGILAGTDGEHITIHNASSATVTVAHQSGSASAADRIITTDGSSLLIDPNEGAEFIYDATQARWVVKSITTSAAGGAASIDNVNMVIDNFGFEVTVAASAATIALKQVDGTTDPTGGSPVKVMFPDNDGSSTTVSVTSATSVTITSGATLGHADATASPVYIYAINNAGTLELAVTSVVKDILGGISTTAMSAAADDDDIYSTTARAGVQARLLGVWISTQATAGTWASATGDKSTSVHAIDESRVGDVVAATSSSFALSTAGFLSGEFPAMTGNSVTLGAGRWLLLGETDTSTGTATGWEAVQNYWGLTNGANDSTTPTSPTFNSGKQISALRIGGVTWESTDFPAAPITLDITESDEIFLVPRPLFSSAGTGTMTTYITAIRLR